MSLARFGESGYSNNVRKFGRIEALSSGEVGVVWDGGNGYDGWLNDIAEGTEEFLSIVSDSPLDTYVDGKGGHAGAELIQPTGQGANGIEKAIVVPLNGTTPVITSSHSPEKFQTVYTAQTYGGLKDPIAAVKSNVGTITISSAITGKVMAIILPGLARTQMMIWRCPKNNYAEFRKIDVYPVSNKPAVIKLLGRSPLTLQSWLTVGIVDVSGVGDIKIIHPFPDYIAPQTDLCLIITAGVNDVDCSAQMWLEKKPIRDYENQLEQESE